MDTSINILNFIRKITDSDEEFLAVIEEMNRWVEDEDQSRPIYVPNNIGWLNFTRDECEQALNTATKAIQDRKINRDHRQYNSPNRASQSSGNNVLFR